MGLLSRLGRAAARGARRTGRGVIRGASEAGDAMDVFSNYALITGGLGGLGGMLMGAGAEQDQGGTPEQINEAALHGGRMGAVMGPLTFGPAVALTAAAGPMGGAPIVPYALYTGSAADRPRQERERRRMQEEAEMLALEQRLRGLHR